MIRIFLIICCLLSVHKDEPTISWNEFQLLSWADFKAKPINSSSAVAITASGITFGFSISQTDSKQVVGFTTEVFAHFYPEQSWYKIEATDSNILGHEQLHFDITELFARKFRQRISQLMISNNVRTELKEIHNIINTELSKMQNKYDIETDHSRNHGAQASWKLFITKELHKLSKYKSLD